MWNSSPHSAEETERIKGFQKDFYKCIDVSTRVGLEISRSVKSRTGRLLGCSSEWTTSCVHKKRLSAVRDRPSV